MLLLNRFLNVLRTNTYSLISLLQNPVQELKYAQTVAKSRLSQLNDAFAKVKGERIYLTNELVDAEYKVKNYTSQVKTLPEKDAKEVIEEFLIVAIDEVEFIKQELTTIKTTEAEAEKLIKVAKRQVRILDQRINQALRLNSFADVKELVANTLASFSENDNFSNIEESIIKIKKRNAYTSGKLEVATSTSQHLLANDGRVDTIYNDIVKWVFTKY